MAKNSCIADIFRKKTMIRYSSLDSKGQLKLISILNFFQDVSAEHAFKMGISGFDLAKKNFAWVVSRYQIKIRKSPQWNDEILIKTWRIPYKNLYELRYFNIQDKHGINIINATGIWIMVKKENSRPVRLSRFIPDYMLWENRGNSGQSFFNNPVIQNLNQTKELRIPGKIHCQIPFKVRMQDIDLNQHVNNAIYVEWAVETIPKNFTQHFTSAQVDVTFHKPSFYGDTILSNTEIIEDSNVPTTLHSIIREKENKHEELARVNIIWNKN